MNNAHLQVLVAKPPVITVYSVNSCVVVTVTILPQLSHLLIIWLSKSTTIMKSNTLFFITSIIK